MRQIIPDINTNYYDGGLWILNPWRTFKPGDVLLVKRFEYSCAANDPGSFQNKTS